VTEVTTNDTIGNDLSSGCQVELNFQYVMQYLYSQPSYVQLFPRYFPLMYPAPGDDELRMYRKIITSPVCMPAHFSPAACDLVARLLQKDPAARLGTGPLGMPALKAHPWFQAINWEALTEHR
jgi:serine/threonine protein kinase